jgi:hypothetical protein
VFPLFSDRDPWKELRIKRTVQLWAERSPVTAPPPPRRSLDFCFPFISPHSRVACQDWQPNPVCDSASTSRTLPRPRYCHLLVYFHHPFVVVPEPGNRPGVDRQEPSLTTTRPFLQLLPTRYRPECGTCGAPPKAPAMAGSPGDGNITDTQMLLCTVYRPVLNIK